MSFYNLHFQNCQLSFIQSVIITDVIGRILKLCYIILGILAFEIG
jgi:hypothetical protein